MLVGDFLYRFLCIFVCFLFLIGGVAVVCFGDSDDSSFSDSVSDAVPSPDDISSLDSSEVASDDISVSSGEVVPDSDSLDSVPVSGTGSSGSDSGSVVSVDGLTVYADNVLMSVPEDNVYPSGAPLVGGLYMEVSTSQLGDILIYVPTSYQYKSFTYNTDGAPVNITSSTITGYYYGSADYNVRWSSFGQAQYRLVSGGYSYQDLDITDVLNTNIVFVESIDDLPVVPDTDMLSVILIFLVGVIVLCLFIKRF